MDNSRQNVAKFYGEFLSYSELLALAKLIGEIGCHHILDQVDQLVVQHLDKLQDIALHNAETLRMLRRNYIKLKDLFRHFESK